MSEAAKERGSVTRLLRAVLGVLGFLLAAAAFYLCMVMGQPQSAASDASAQPVLTASPARSITELSELRDMLTDFPCPALLSSTGLTLEGAASYDASFEDGCGRILRLVYRTDGGVTVQVDSIYPARALSLMDGGSYRVSGTAGHSVAGQRTIRMENSAFVRLHFQTDRGLYAVTVPQSAAEDMSDLVRSLQLYTVE